MPIEFEKHNNGPFRNWGNDHQTSGLPVVHSIVGLGFTKVLVLCFLTRAQSQLHLWLVRQMFTFQA